MAEKEFTVSPIARTVWTTRDHAQPAKTLELSERARAYVTSCASEMRLYPASFTEGFKALVTEVERFLSPPPETARAFAEKTVRSILNTGTKIEQFEAAAAEWARLKALEEAKKGA
jgi:hypothetical protein